MTSPRCPWLRAGEPPGLDLRVVGDSFTAGVGAGDSEGFARVLAALP